MTARDMKPSAQDNADINKVIAWAERPRANTHPKRVNVDFPMWMVQALDREAKTLGVTRQSLIKLWIADRLT